MTPTNEERESLAELARELGPELRHRLPGMSAADLAEWLTGALAVGVLVVRPPEADEQAKEQWLRRLRSLPDEEFESECARLIEMNRETDEFFARLNLDTGRNPT